MLNSLRIQAAQVSLESISGADIRNLLTNAFPSIVSEVKSYFSQFNPSDRSVMLAFDKYGFNKELGKHNYMDIGPLSAFIPEGLDVKYIPYSEELVKAAEHAAKVLSGTMATYTVFLSQLINNADAKLASDSFDKVYENLSKEREQINAALGKCFKKGSTKSETTISEVVDRNNDWQKVFENADVMVKLIESVDRKALNKKIEESTKLLEVIMEKIRRDEFVGMSPEVIRNLSDGAYCMASELEFYSVTHYKILAFTTCLNRTIDHFEKVFKK